MSNDLVASFSSCGGPWGNTSVAITSNEYHYYSQQIPGRAEAALTRFGVKIAQHGPGICATTYVFAKKPPAFFPPPVQAGVLGVRLLYIANQRSVDYRPEAGETFVLAIDPSGIAVTAERSGVIRPVVRAKIEELVAALVEHEQPRVAEIKRLATEPARLPAA